MAAQQREVGVTHLSQILLPDAINSLISELDE
jgi:hypothetical protein